jgi:hypothetical protein
MHPRPKLTFANLAATVALLLAVGGSSVYAAGQLGKNDVRSKNIAPGAVKTSDLAKSAVTSRKVRNGTLRTADVASGVIRNEVANVTGSASGGPVVNPSTTGTPVPLSGTTTFTPQADQAAALVLEAQFTIASKAGTNCSPAVGLLVNGQPTQAAAETSGTTSLAPVTQFGRDGDAAFGLINPGAPLTVSAEVFGDSDCTPESKLDKLEVRILQIH